MAALRLVDGTLLPLIPYFLSPFIAIIMDAMRWSKRKKQLERVETMNEKRLKLRPSEEEGLFRNQHVRQRQTLKH